MNRKCVEKLIVEMLDYQVWPDTSGQEKVQANTFGALGRFDPFVILAVEERTGVQADYRR